MVAAALEHIPGGGCHRLAAFSRSAWRRRRGKISDVDRMLGLDDNSGAVLSNSNSVDGGWAMSQHATQQDYEWAFGPELKAGKTDFTVGQYEGIKWCPLLNRGNRKW